VVAVSRPFSRWQSPAGWYGGGVEAPTVDGVLALLDGFSALEEWPRTIPSGPRRSHGLRAIAARHGDDWGLAIEQIEGDRPGAVFPVRIAVHAFGSRVGKKVKGAQVSSRPLPVAGAPSNPEPFTRWLRDRLIKTPDAVWGPPAASLGALGLPRDARIVAVVPVLAHVDPPGRPSESPAYRALAEALAAAPSQPAILA
jgi:hypothetical protein